MAISKDVLPALSDEEGPRAVKTALDYSSLEIKYPTPITAAQLIREATIRNRVRCRTVHSVWSGDQTFITLSVEGASVKRAIQSSSASLRSDFIQRALYRFCPKSKIKGTEWE
jgi:hypothetical protein